MNPRNAQMVQYILEKQMHKNQAEKSRAYRKIFSKIKGRSNRNTINIDEFSQLLNTEGQRILTQQNRFIAAPSNSSNVTERVVKEYVHAYVYIMIKFGDLVHDLKDTRGQGRGPGYLKNLVDGGGRTNKLGGLEVIMLKIDIQKNPNGPRNKGQYQRYKGKVLDVFDKFFNNIQWLHPTTRRKILADRAAKPEVYNDLRSVLADKYNKEGSLATELLRALGVPNVDQIFERRPRNFFNGKELVSGVRVGGYLVDMTRTGSASAVTSKIELPAIYSWDTTIDKGASQGGATPGGIPKALMLNMASGEQEFITDFKFDADMSGFRIRMKDNPTEVIEEFGIEYDGTTGSLKQYVKLFNSNTGTGQKNYSDGMSADQARLAGNVGLSEADHKTIGDAMIILRALNRGYIHVTGDRSASGICAFIIACVQDGEKLLSIFEDTNTIAQVSIALREAFVPKYRIDKLKAEIYSEIDKKLDANPNLPINRRNYIFRELSKEIAAEGDRGELLTKLTNIRETANVTNMLKRNIFKNSDEELLEYYMKKFLANKFVKATPNFGNNISVENIQKLTAEIQNFNIAIRGATSAVLGTPAMRSLLAQSYTALQNQYKEARKEVAATMNSPGLANEGKGGVVVDGPEAGPEAQAEAGPMNAQPTVSNGTQNSIGTLAPDEGAGQVGGTSYFLPTASEGQGSVAGGPGNMNGVEVESIREAANRLTKMNNRVIQGTATNTQLQNAVKNAQNFLPTGFQVQIGRDAAAAAPPPGTTTRKRPRTEGRYRGKPNQRPTTGPGKSTNQPQAPNR